MRSVLTKARHAFVRAFPPKAYGKYDIVMPDFWRFHAVTAGVLTVAAVITWNPAPLLFIWAAFTGWVASWYARSYEALAEDADRY